MQRVGHFYILHIFRGHWEPRRFMGAMATPSHPLLDTPLVLAY